MAKKVLKFGGTSVGTTERILHVAKIIKKEYVAGNEVIAIVSAMSGKTNELLDQSKSISNNFITAVYEKNSYKFDDIANVLKKNNIKILDIATEDGDLEDVFVQLTNH